MGKMALRLRKDVQKASYYVWFLGAQEARGLRGSRILLPVIPRLIERTHENEPLKVTLQVSHKGLKIIQGSSKHFIPHSAITCSVQTDDIVACVLLLYNPATRCPLHVHAYRCDSKTTAQALNQQLQILINRPENQKRFNELEARLGLTSQEQLQQQQQHSQKEQQQKEQQPPSPTTTNNSTPKSPSKPVQRHFELSPKRFDSSLGSDTGTSTRESECSEDHSLTSPLMPVAPNLPKANLYDSLAAELRAKLNGNGPPLLLPPRDYDTVHRSKGNLAAIELRRCRNQSIVGGATKPGAVVSSRGSSGIGSDLAPSPERQEGQTSSDEDWGIEHHHEIIAPTPRRSPPEETILPTKHNKNTPAYIYPRENNKQEEKFKQEIKENVRYKRSSTREEEKSQNDSINSREEEEEVKPILNKLRASYRESFDEKKFGIENDRRYSHGYDEKKIISPSSNEKRHNNGHEQQRFSAAEQFREEDVKNYRKQTSDRGKYIDHEIEYRNEPYRENLTDKQKYRESLAEKRINQIKYQERTIDRKDRYVEDSLEKLPAKFRDSSIDKNGYSRKDEHEKNRYNREKSMDRKKYSENDNDREAYRGGRIPEDYHVNPYKQPDNKPYRESIEKMLKSPVMRYKSIDDSRYINPVENTEWNHRGKEERKRYSSSDRYRDMSPAENYREEPNSRYRVEEINPPRSSRKYFDEKTNIIASQQPEIPSKISPKDRFQDAKEKFQAMERERIRVQEKNKLVRKSSMEPSRRGSLEPQQPVRVYSEKNNSHDGWSSDEEPVLRNREPSSRYRERESTPQSQERYTGFEREPSQSRIVPSKSLGNLVKGYRHSYAEPQPNRKPLGRTSGRVGLAAVNPY